MLLDSSFRWCVAVNKVKQGQKRWQITVRNNPVLQELNLIYATFENNRYFNETSVSFSYCDARILHMSHILRKPVMPYANSKGADQSTHPRSLSSTFVVRCLDRIISILAKSKISRL